MFFLSPHCELWKVWINVLCWAHWKCHSPSWVLLTDNQLVPITTEVTCRRDGFRGLLRSAQAKIPVQTLPFSCQLTQRTHPYAEQGMLTRSHRPAALKAGRNKKGWMPLCLQREYRRTAEGDRALPRGDQQRLPRLASPRRAAFIRRQLLLERLDCSLCLSPVWTSHLVLAVYQENLFIAELIRVKEELIFAVGNMQKMLRLAWESVCRVRFCCHFLLEYRVLSLYRGSKS